MNCLKITKIKDVIARARARARREARAPKFLRKRASARGSAERENHARFFVGRAERARAQI